MLLLTAPFALAALIVYLGGNCYAAIGVAWFLMLAIGHGLTTSGGVLGED